MMEYKTTKYLWQDSKMLQLLKSPSNIFKNPLGMLENIALGQLSYNSQQLLAYWIFPLFKSFNHMLSGDS